MHFIYTHTHTHTHTDHRVCFVVYRLEEEKSFLWLWKNRNGQTKGVSLARLTSQTC